MSNVPPLPGLTRYTHRADVPDGLHTKTELGQMDPPLKPGAPPVAQVLYHGNNYAPLYQADQAVPKRRCTPAQRAALDRARGLQHVCRRCGDRHDHPLGRGRWCGPCSRAAGLHAAHAHAQRSARAITGDPAAALLVVAAGPGEHPQPETAAVLRVHDQALLHAGPAGAYGTPERAAVLDRLDQLLDGRRVVHETDQGPAGRYPAMLVTPPGHLPSSSRDGLHTWLRPHRESPQTADYVLRLWRNWHAWTGHPASTTADTPWNRDQGHLVPWSRTADADADGQDLTALLHRIADGTEPIWNHAAWLDGHGTPAQGDTQ